VTRARIPLTLLLLALGAPAGAGQGQDPRIAEADALLGDAEGFGRAAALYAEVLAVDPEAAEVRLKRARVLAWDQRYGESLAEYDLLRAAPGPSPGGAELELERAEVLSWAGRSEEAEAAFAAILAADPGHARAARGLARTLAWSGRASAADRAYARALELEDDPEARGEWARLRAGHPPSLDQGFDYYEDSDGFRRLRASSLGGVYVDLDTRATLEVGVTRLDASPRLLAPGTPDDDRAVDALAGVGRRFGEGLEGRLAVGGRSWERAEARFLGRARVDWTLPVGGSLGLWVDHGDFLDRSDSLAAVEAGIGDTTTGLSLWRDLGRRVEYWGRFESSFLSDANERLALESSLSWRPFEARELRLTLAGSALGYTRSSDLYYDPESDLSAGIAVSHRLELPLDAELELRAGGGYGRSEQDGASSAGFAYELGGALSWVTGPLRLRFYGGRAQSRRESSYVSHRGGASVGLDF
jgi:tetratricopeptide (TPR) repeat protein